MRNEVDFVTCGIDDGDVRSSSFLGIMILFANCGEVGAVAQVVKFLWLCVKLVLLREKGKV